MADVSCYWPDGSPAYQMWPCPDESSIKHCCFDINYCLTDHLCFDQYALITYRGACSSSTWSNDSCGSNCLAVSDKPNGFLTCLDDETGNLEGNWVCFGQNCSDEIGLDIGPGMIQSNDPLRLELYPSSSSSVPSSNSVRLGVGLGLGLGVPLIAALICLLALWKRFQAVHTLNQHQTPSVHVMESWPKQTHTSPVPFGVVQFENEVLPTRESVLMSTQNREMAELGDTSAVDVRVQESQRVQPARYHNIWKRN